MRKSDERGRLLSLQDGLLDIGGRQLARTEWGVHPDNVLRSKAYLISRAAARALLEDGFNDEMLEACENGLRNWRKDFLSRSAAPSFGNRFTYEDVYLLDLRMVGATFETLSATLRFPESVTERNFLPVLTLLDVEEANAALTSGDAFWAGASLVAGQASLMLWLSRRSHKQRSSAGGKKKRKPSPVRVAVETEERRLLNEGRPPHGIAAMIAKNLRKVGRVPRFFISAHTVRYHLNKAHKQQT